MLLNLYMWHVHSTVLDNHLLTLMLTNIFSNSLCFCFTRKQQRTSIQERYGASPSPQAAKGRHRILCSMLFCSSKVIHLPRHMRKVHNWTKKAARKVLFKFNIQEQWEPERGKRYFNTGETERLPSLSLVCLSVSSLSVSLCLSLFSLSLSYLLFFITAK